MAACQAGHWCPAGNEVGGLDGDSDRRRALRAGVRDAHADLPAGPRAGVGAGLSAGGVLLRTSGWRIIPYASVTVQRASTTVHDIPFVGTDSHAHDTGGVFGFGVGVAAGSRVTVGPSVAMRHGIRLSGRTASPRTPKDAV
jgi:hypothetical protein